MCNGRLGDLGFGDYTPEIVTLFACSDLELLSSETLRKNERKRQTSMSLFYMQPKLFDVR